MLGRVNISVLELHLLFLYHAKQHAPFTFQTVQSDHGPEFSAHFTERLGTKHRHSRVRKPNDNAHVERFNRTLQEECLDQTTHNITSFRKVLKAYLSYYDTERIHMGINFQTPEEVLRRC